MNMAQRRQAVVDAFDRYETMNILLACLARSPCLWDEEDDEVSDLMHELVDNGLLRNDGNYFTTTGVGRAALIAYINGDDIYDGEDFNIDIDS